MFSWTPYVDPEAVKRAKHRDDVHEFVSITLTLMFLSICVVVAAYFLAGTPMSEHLLEAAEVETSFASRLATEL